MLPQTSLLDKLIDKGEHREQVLARRCPTEITGRHNYLRELEHLQLQKVQRTGQASVSQKHKKLIMQHHGKTWANAPEHIKADYDRKALREQSKQMAELRAEIALVEDTLLECATELKEQREYDRQFAPLAFGACSLADSDFELVETLVSEPDLQGKGLQRLMGYR